MKLNIKFIAVAIFCLLITVPVVLATSADFQQYADTFYNRHCQNPNSTSVSNVGKTICYLIDKSRENDIIDSSQSGQIAQLENKTSNQKRVFAVGQVRGAGLDTDAPTIPIKTPGEVTVNCPEACLLWVNYDVDTRNTQIPTAGSWYQHLYHIYIDDIDQAVYNQVSAAVPNAAYPLSVNGVFPVSAGQHTVSIWVKVTGGHLQQFTSHLQVMAIEQ